MKEIGGYIELDRYTLPMLHDGALALNCGRNCLAYLIRARNIKRIMLPRFLCDSVREVCIKAGVEVRYYSVGVNFMPKDGGPGEDEWLYVVNYYGQLDNMTFCRMAREYKRVIVDNAQAYFQMPVPGADTLYTCRKFFGVADGAFLYTDAASGDLADKLPRDESYGRMRFLLGRFERTASEFYGEYADNNLLFRQAPVKRMSKLTENLLHGIVYEEVKRRRTENFSRLHDAFHKMNRLQLSVPDGAFMYPLYVESGPRLRRKLQEEKIYVPMLWPEVNRPNGHDICGTEALECDLAENILPLPVDQRYGRAEMEYIAKEVLHAMEKGEKRLGGVELLPEE